MLGVDENKLRQPLLKRVSVFRALSKVSFVLLLTATAFFVLVIGVLLFSAGLSAGSNGLLISFYVARGALSAILYLILALFFRSLASGNPPFTLEQARRLRIAAVLLVADAFFGLVSIPGATSLPSVGPIQLPAPTPTFDLRSFALAALLLVISYAFEYGERLQDDSDEIA
jgi:hypothetical protein